MSTSPYVLPVVTVKVKGVDRTKHTPNYRFDYTTNLPNYSSMQYPGLQREYAEFTRLAVLLHAAHPGRLLPPLPLPTTNHTEESEDERLTSEALERWLLLVANHPVVGRDDNIRAFVEAKVMFAPPPPKVVKKSSGLLAGLKARIGGASGPGPVVTEEDAYFATAKHSAGVVEAQCIAAERGSSRLIKARLALATAQSDFAHKAITHGETEEDAQLSEGLTKLGKSIQVISEVNESQSIEELALLSDHLTYQARMAQVTKDALIEREGIVVDSRTATQTTERKRAQLEKIRAGTRPERIPGAIAELEEAERYEKYAAEQVVRITKAISEDMPSYIQACAVEMRAGFREYARAQLQRERAKLRALEAVGSGQSV